MVMGLVAGIALGRKIIARRPLTNRFRLLESRVKISQMKVGATNPSQYLSRFGGVDAAINPTVRPAGHCPGLRDHGDGGQY